MSLTGSGVSYQAPVRQLLAASNSTVTHTGDTSETALVNVRIPPLGPNDQIIISLLWSYTNSANVKTFRIRLSTTSGTGGTAMMSLVPTTTAAQRVILEIGNRNATNSQVSGMGTGGTAASSGSFNTASVETSAGGFLNLTATLANSGESINLEMYRIELVRV
jgi:hypothetical protein